MYIKYPNSIVRLLTFIYFKGQIKPDDNDDDSSVSEYRLQRCLLRSYFYYIEGLYHYFDFEFIPYFLEKKFECKEYISFNGI